MMQRRYGISQIRLLEAHSLSSVSLIGLAKVQTKGQNYNYSRSLRISLGAVTVIGVCQNWLHF